MNKFYLHLMDGGNIHRPSIIVIDEKDKNPNIENVINGFLLMAQDGPARPYQRWTLGPCSESEARNLAFLIARYYNCDVMINGVSLGFQYDDRVSKAAACLGAIKTAKKAAASRENGKKGGRPKKAS